MQFNLEQGGGIKLISSYSESSVTVEDQCYQNSLILLGDRIVSEWAVESVENLTIELLEPVLAAGPEIFLLGTGDRQQFPNVELMKALAQRNRSVDVMDSGAACRTYNVLASEFRSVAAALILPGEH